jgi:hypothetical protein
MNPAPGMSTIGSAAPAAPASPSRSRRGFDRKGFVMSGRKLPIYAAACLFLALAAASFWRLLVGFPVSIGGVFIGMPATFFVAVIATGLALALFFSGRTAS